MADSDSDSGSIALGDKQFWFTCEDIYQKKNTPDNGTIPDNIWKPPKPHKWNKKRNPSSNKTPYHNKYAYFFNGTGVTVIGREALATLMKAGEVKRKKTISIYHYGELHWAVNFDASLKNVGDGAKPNTQVDASKGSNSESDDETADAGEERMDWSLVQFNHADGLAGTSTLQIGGSHIGLYATRADQIWPEWLFPARNQPELQRNRNTPGTAPPWGSLTGDLCLMIAFVAFSVPVIDVTHALTNCINADGWRALEHPSGPGQGRDPKRGMVITLYIRKDDEEDFDTYERLAFFQ